MASRVVGIVSALVLVAAVITGCGSTESGEVGLASAPPLPTLTSTSSAPCPLKTTRDLIERDQTPNLPASAVRIGNVNFTLCAPTLDTWRSGVPSGPGFCSQIAYADDNPDYDVNAIPAAPLRKVLDVAGDGC